MKGTASPPDHLYYTSSTIVTCNTGHTRARSRGSNGSAIVHFCVVRTDIFSTPPYKGVSDGTHCSADVC